MSKADIRIEAMAEILETLGVSATHEQIVQITKDYQHHIEMEGEMDSYSHAGYKEPCSKCQSLEDKLKLVTKERDAYHQSVCKRRNTNDVWIEDGEVKYNP